MNNAYSQAKRARKLKTNTLANIHCLVTGFDPFNEQYHNPSASIAMAMPKQLLFKKHNLKISIQNLVLPSAGGKAWTILKAEIDSLPTNEPSIIIMLGQAAQRKVIGLERFALNFRDYRIKDNAGNMFVAQTINKRAPEALRTKAPIDEAFKYILSQELPIETSNYCGTFVCNEIYFLAMHYVNQLKLPHMVYFVHVPLPRIYGKALARSNREKWSKLSAGRDNQLAAMTATIELLAKFSAEYIIRK